MTFATGSLAACGDHRRMCRASVTDLPRTRSMTRRALVGETRTKRAFATADGYSVVILIKVLCSSRKRSSLLRLAVVLDVTLERAGRRELAELVPDHRLGDEHRDMLAAVVDREGVPDEVGDGRRRTDPSSGCVASAISYRWCFLPVRRRRTMSLSLGLCALRVRPSGLPHGLTGWRPPEVLPSPPPCGWSTGFITTPRTVGRLPFHRMRPALPQLMFACSALPTWPTVARQRTSTRRISPLGMRSEA